MLVNLLILQASTFTATEEPVLPFEDAFFEIGGQRIAPSPKIEQPYERQVDLGTALVRICERKVVGVDGPSGKQVWSFPSPSPGRLALIATGGHLACFFSLVSSNEGRTVPKSLLVFDALRKTWETIPAERATDKIASPPQVIAADVRDGEVALLSSQWIGDEFEPTATFYAVSVYPSGSKKPLWVKRFQSRGGRANGRGFLLAASYPNFADEGIRRLTWLRSSLLVSAGPKDPVMLLSADRGNLQTSIERPWEFDRGFIGPSIWQHYISRFGKDSFDGEQNPKNEALLRAEFEKMAEASIVAGPVFVPTKGADGSVFLVVSFEPKKSFGGYLGRYRLYEFGLDGEPKSLAELPRLPVGTPFPYQGSIVWPSQNGSLYRFATSESGHFGMGPGGPDLITRLVYFREFENLKGKAWLTSPSSTSQVAFSTDIGIRSIDGAYVSSRNQRELRLPLGIVDLQEGTQKQMDLVLTTKSPIERPNENFSRTDTTQRQMSAFGFSITRIECVAGQLQICVADSTQTYGFHLPLAALKR